MTDVQPAALLRGVSKTYTLGELEVPALQGINLVVEARRFLMIVGASGSGKTTLLNMLGCIDAPTTGRVTVAGTDVNAMKDNAVSDFRARNIGFIFQHFSLIPVLTAYENVEYPLLLARRSQKVRREMTMNMLTSVGLSDQAAKRPDQMSGGQRQRVAIARALVMEPKLVLADEPTANLDSETGSAIVELMRRVQKACGTTFVFATHDSSLMAHADGIVEMRDGRLSGQRLEVAQ